MSLSSVFLRVKPQWCPHTCSSCLLRAGDEPAAAILKPLHALQEPERRLGLSGIIWILCLFYNTVLDKQAPLLQIVRTKQKNGCLLSSLTSTFYVF